MERKMLKPGTVIRQRYIIECAVGAGGFGITYRARDPILDVTVAVKEYREGTERFLQEARIMARFRSCAQIVYVYDFFEEDGAAYIIMEFLEGETLKERIGRRGSMPAREAVRVMIPVLKALETVHRAGIIHRDVAPDNIYLLKNGKVKLFDFGNALETGCAPGCAVVKHGYSPPEQYHPEMMQTPLADVYAAGACLYRMLTAKIPPPAPEREAGRSHSAEAADLKTADRYLTAIIRKAMKTVPEKRYTDAHIFRRELERYLRQGKAHPFLPVCIAAFTIGMVLISRRMKTGQEVQEEYTAEQTESAAKPSEKTEYVKPPEYTEEQAIQAARPAEAEMQTAHSAEAEMRTVQSAETEVQTAQSSEAEVRTTQTAGQKEYGAEQNSITSEGRDSIAEPEGTNERPEETMPGAESQTDLQTEPQLSDRPEIRTEIRTEIHTETQTEIPPESRTEEYVIPDLM